MKIVGLPTLSDNYTWVILSDNPQDKSAWIVDPGESRKVIEYFHQNQLELVGILLTHHHYDHTGGIAAVRTELGDVPIVSNAHGPYKPVTYPVTDGDEIQVHSETFKVMATPGHTHEHISFYHPKALFCGDAMFTAGCGKTWTQAPGVMAQSLLKIRELPDSCAVYCGHEYTYANLNFAMIAEPDNLDMATRQTEVKRKTRQGEPCVPALLGLEKKTNPFLRFDQSPLKETLANRAGKAELSNEQAYATLRAWKDELDKTGTLEAGLND